MATKRDDGGSAFPSRASGHVQPPEGSASRNLSFELIGGMSLRDYFAGQALVGLIVNNVTVSPDVPISMRAYELADAMLAERLK